MGEEKRDDQHYCKLLTEQMREMYTGIGQVFCPVLNCQVRFTAQGFHHLRYKPGGTARKTRERIYKLTLLPLAIPVIKKAGEIYQEREVEIRSATKKGAKKIKGTTYAVVATVGKKNPVPVRVILLRIGNGDVVFWSIMKS